MDHYEGEESDNSDSVDCKGAYNEAENQAKIYENLWRISFG